MPKTKKKTVWGKALGVSVLCLSFGQSALAQGYPVSDAQTRANTAAAAEATQSTNALTTVMAQSVEALQAAIGPAGNTGGVGPGVAGAVGSGTQFYQNMQKFGFDMCAVSLCRGGDPVGTKNIEEARTWAMKNLYTQGDGNGRALDESSLWDLDEIRRRAVAYSATNALALSVTLHNELAGADGTANALESKVGEAAHIRADIQANSAILLAQYKVQLQQLAVLTTQMDVMATSAINGTDFYHEEGGSRFADAFLEEDFDRSSAGKPITRRSVTLPARGQGALGLLR
jgi:hypothetical protein